MALLVVLTCALCTTAFATDYGLGEGYVGGTLAAGNYAWSGMTVVGTIDSDTDAGTNLYYSTINGLYTVQDDPDSDEFDWTDFGFDDEIWTIPTGDDALYQLPTLMGELSQNPLANLEFITITFDYEDEGTVDATVSIEIGGTLAMVDIPDAPTGMAWDVDDSIVYFVEATITASAVPVSTSSGSSNVGTIVYPDESTTTTDTTTEDDVVTEETTPTVAGFEDVFEGDYYADAVTWAADKGITTGKTDETFDPNATNTRGEAVTFLWRAMTNPSASMESIFEDVYGDEYYAEAVAWANEMGIALGISETEFGPILECSRAHIITFLWRAAGSPEVEITDEFDDVDPEEYYAMAVAWAVSEGITEGTDPAIFSPDDPCSRGQIVTFLYRYLGE